MSGPEHTIAAGLDVIRKRFGVAADLGDHSTSRPIFVMASGWRSGSTLLQRLLVSSSDVLIWGEPYDHSATIRRLAETLVPFDDAWPPDRYLVSGAADVSSDQWIANRYPHPHDFVAAHRAFLDRLFAEPARRAGFERWGLKTVRLGGDHAQYLRALYPDALVVLLVRNPYDAFLSYRLLHDVRPNSYWWYDRWPEEQVRTAAEFGAMWRRLVGSFCDVAHDLGALFISFEAMVTGQSLEELARFSGLAVEPDVLHQRLGASTQQRRQARLEQLELRSDEIEGLRREVEPVAGELGYLGPSPTVAG